MTASYLNKKSINEIQKKLNYKFKSKKIFHIAFTHSSFANNQNIQDNERLEFLGDSVLQLCTTKYLYDNFDLSEGKLSKMRAYIVSTENLSKALEYTGLISYLKIKNQPQRMKSIQADLFEAIVGAIYIDGGYRDACKFIKKKLQFSKKSFAKLEVDSKDYKTQLQEIVQSNNLGDFAYDTKRSSGPSHNPKFTSKLIIDKKVLSEGTGYSKKEAEISAAYEGVSKLSQAIKNVKNNEVK